jgi:hypothetical protein
LNFLVVIFNIGLFAFSVKILAKKVENGVDALV